MTKLKIRVTKEILDRSKMCNTDINVGMESNQKCEGFAGANCAIALAVRDIFPNAWVDIFCIIPFAAGNTGLDIFRSISYPKPDNYIRLPQIASDFISRFDKAEPQERVQMPEMEFEVEIPDEVIEQVNISEVATLLANHPTLKLQEV